MRANPQKVKAKYQKIIAKYGYLSEYEFYMAEYIGKKKTTRQIADMMNKSYNCIRLRIKRSGVQLRSRGGINRTKSNPETGKMCTRCGTRPIPYPNERLCAYCYKTAPNEYEQGYEYH